MNIGNNFSVGTTFNKRLYESKHQEIIKSMQETYPKIDFFVFHENDFEQKKYGDGVNIKETWDCFHVYDLFKLNGWLYDFLNNSPFKDSHKIGNPGTFDPPHYWKRNGIFWFRKVVAVNTLIEMNVVKTPYLFWLGCDTKWIKKLDKKFYDYIVQYDISHINRKPLGHFTETDIIIFNISKPIVIDFIKSWLNFYVTGNIFKENRWDDCIAFDKTKDAFIKLFGNKIKFGSLSNRTGCPFNVYDYLFHWKRPMHKIRDKRMGI